MTTVELIQARFDAALPALPPGVPDDIQWMPPGRHEIFPSINGEETEQPLVVEVNASLAAKFAGQLQHLRSEAAAGRADLPFFDFNHEDAAAAAEVLDLYWAGTDPRTGGIRARVAWTTAGRAALEGKTFRRFSPQWFTHKDTRQPLGIGVNLGGLVNRAAFKTIQPVVAKQAGPAFACVGAAATNQPKTTMTEAEKNELKTLVADAVKPFGDRIAALETKATNAQTASAKGTEDLTTTLTNALKPVTDRLAALETSAKNTTEAAADALVQEACARGAIAPQDETTKAFWKQTLITNAAAKDQLAKLPSNPALATVTAGASTKGGGTAAAPATAEGFVQLVQAKVKGGKAKSAALDESIVENEAGYKAWREANGKPGL